MKIANYILGILVIGAGIIIVPFLLNYFISSRAICDVIGGEEAPETWLGFWGNYAGGIIGALMAGLISIYVLFKTLTHNEVENNKNRLFELEQDLRNDIAERLSKLNVPLRFTIELFSNNISVNSEIQRMESLDKQIHNEYESLAIKYGCENHLFMQTYKGEMLKLSGALNEIKELLYNLPEAHSEEELKESNNSYQSVAMLTDDNRKKRYEKIKKDYSERSTIKQKLDSIFDAVTQYDIATKVTKNAPEYIQEVIKRYRK